MPKYPLVILINITHFYTSGKFQLFGYILNLELADGFFTKIPPVILEEKTVAYLPRQND